MLKMTFISSTKITLENGKPKKEEYIIHVREYVDGDEKPERLKNAVVQNFEFQPNKTFFQRSLQEYFPAGISVTGLLCSIVLPTPPEDATLKKLAEKLKTLNLDEHKIPLTHPVRH